MQVSPTQQAPEGVIRRYLDENGGATDATVEHLLVSFGVAEDDVAGRVWIGKRLAEEGVLVEPPIEGLGVNEPVRVALAEYRHRFPRPANGQGPVDVVRSTVEAEGGSFLTDVPALLEAFGRKQLTKRAREDVSAALAAAKVRTDPDLNFATRHDPLYLFLADAPPATAAAEEDGDDHASRRRPWQAWAVGGILVVVALVAVIGGAREVGVGSKSVAVPELVGLSAAAAERRLGYIDLSARYQNPPDNANACEVVWQDVEPGVDVDTSTTIGLRCRLAVPEVTGMNAAAADEELFGLGFRPRFASRPAGVALSECRVVAQDQPRRARPGARVLLRVAC